MASYTQNLFTIACILLLVTISPVLSFETVSIISLYPANQHSCVAPCVCASYYYSDIGSALQCGNPYANDCYCNTAAKSASAASSWLTACAAAACAAGDRSDDLVSMQSIYASYCIGAGYTQPGATNWYNPATVTETQKKTTTKSTTNPANPSQTANSGPPATTTQVTMVTHTAPSTGGSAAMQPQVTRHLTSTVWVGADGKPVPAPSTSKSNKTALGAGLGVGIPLVLALAAIGLWACLRNRRRPSAPEEYSQPVKQSSVPGQEVSQVIPGGVSPVSRRPVPSPSQTGQTANDMYGELSGQQLNPIPRPGLPGSPVSLLEHHEMSAESQPGTLYRSGNPPPSYFHAVTSPAELGDQTDTCRR